MRKTWTGGGGGARGSSRTQPHHPNTGFTVLAARDHPIISLIINLATSTQAGSPSRIMIIIRPALIIIRTHRIIITSSPDIHANCTVE